MDLLSNPLFLRLSIARFELFLKVINRSSISCDVIEYRNMFITATHKVLVGQVEGQVSYLPCKEQNTSLVINTIASNSLLYNK